MKDNLTSEDIVNKFSLTKKSLQKLGFNNFDTEKYKKLSDVLNSTNGMVLAQVQKNAQIKITEKFQILKKGEVLAMPLGQFKVGKKEKLYKPYRKTFDSIFKRYKGQDLNNKKLLIWRTGGLGDIVVTQSVVKAIKDKFPKAHITYATNPAFQEFFYSWPGNLVDRVESVPFKKELMEEHDYHMMFMHSVENCIETTDMCFFEIFQKVTGLDYDYNNYISELTPLKNVVESVRRAVPNNMLIFHMRSSTKLRALRNEKWLDLIKYYTNKGYKIGVIDAPSKSKEIDGFIKTFKLENVLNLSKICLDLNYSVAACQVALGGICIDSGIAHVMGALRKPVVAICGPYTAFNVYHGYPTVMGIDVDDSWNECDKYPCHFNSQESQCPFITAGMAPGCIDNINIEDIKNKLDEALKNG